MSEAAPTRRDVPPERRKATRRDEPDTGPARTTRDNAETQAVETGGLPAPVFQEYEPIPGGSLDTGGEAHLVMRVRRRSDGAERVVKVYRSTIRPDPALLEALHGADPAHLVGVDSWGEHTDTFGTSVSWEVLEYIPGGSLRSLIDREGPALAEPLVRRLLVELTDALTYLHTQVRYHGSTGLAHRDIKPENVLVRSRAGLDLVLCDFGLVAEIRATRMSSRRAGTAAYQAPETWWERSRGPAQDWWSLGVIVAEMLIGRNPNSGARGEAIEDTVLFEHITTRGGVDLSEVTDPRWHMLCSGLLCLDPDKRWNGEQVRRWLSGESPRVHQGKLAPAATVVAPPLEVAGLPCRTPTDVAAAMSDNFSAACVIFQRRDERLDLNEWLRTNFADVEAALPKDLFRKDPNDRHDAAVRVARFISWVAPELRPRFDGRPTDAAGIAVLAHAAVTDRAAAQVLSRLDAQLLRVFGRHRCVAHPSCRDRDQGCEVLNTAADRLTPGSQALREQISRLNLDRQVAANAEVLLIRALVDPGYVESLRDRFRGRTPARQTTWWRALVEQGDPPALVLAAATEHLAVHAATAERARQAQQRAQERDETRVIRQDWRRRHLTGAGRGVRDLVSWLLAMLLLYVGLMVAVLVSAMIQGHESTPVPVLTGQAVALQTWLTLPAAVVMGCVLFSPGRPFMAATNARWIAILTSVAAGALLASGQAELVAFPVVWRTGVQDLLAEFGRVFMGETSPDFSSVLIGAAVVFLLFGWLMVAFARRRPAADSSPALRVVKRVLIGAVVALFLIRAGQVWLDWQVPGLPAPVSVWLEI